MKVDDEEGCSEAGGEWGRLSWHQRERAEMRRLVNARGWDMASDGQWARLHSPNSPHTPPPPTMGAWPATGTSKNAFVARNPRLQQGTAVEGKGGKKKKASSGGSSSVNLNTHLTSVLEAKIAVLRAEKANQFRIAAYVKAVAALRHHESKIVDAAAARRLDGVGKSIEAEIASILCDGGEAGDSSDDGGGAPAEADSGSLVALTQIWGVGPAKAQQLATAGFGSIECLREAGPRAPLTPMQQIGLKHHNDLCKRIPRSEVGEIAALVQAAVAVQFPSATAMCCGSYRRGEATCGDIDMLVLSPPGGAVVLAELVAELHRTGLLVDDFSGCGSTSYMGVCVSRAGGICRHIDIKVYSHEAAAFAALFFTGSGDFTRAIRHFSVKRSMKLSDKGLFCGTDPTTLSCTTEEEIFWALGLGYVAPESRHNAAQIVPDDAAPFGAAPAFTPSVTSGKGGRQKTLLSFFGRRA